MEFDEFVGEHLPGLTRFAGALTGDRQLGHNVLADTLIRASNRWE